MKKEFIKFLKKNDALIPFVCNLAMLENKSLSDHLNSDNHLAYPLTWINDAFMWYRTTEEEIYWIDLNYIWQHECNS